MPIDQLNESTRITDPTLPKDRLGSKQFATYVDVLGEGVIGGFPSAIDAGYTEGTANYNNAALKDIYLNGTQVHENVHFKVSANGSRVLFEQPPVIGDVLTITYIEAMTVQTRTNVPLLGVVDGVNYEFIVADGGGNHEAILGYYSMLEAIEVYDTSAESDHGSPSGYLWMGAGSGIEVG